MQFLEVAPESKLPWMFVQCLWVLYENIIMFFYLFIGLDIQNGFDFSKRTCVLGHPRIE